jgi:hypothetical protein
VQKGRHASSCLPSQAGKAGALRGLGLGLVEASPLAKAALVRCAMWST